MFGKKDNQSNERVIYKTKPNLIFGCKKAILGIVLLIFALSISGFIIQFIGKMQVYLISQIKLPLTRYAAIAVFVVILVIILFIIWQIVGWYSKEYILTDSKIIVKSGVFLNRKNYMPYATIQDINTSQSIFSKLFNVGSISVFSAYDNNQISIDNVSNPAKVEEIIFSNMSRGRSYQDPRQDFYRNPQEDYRRPNPQNYYNDSNQDYYPSPNHNHYSDDYSDDVVITPIKQEEQYQRRQYEYYPEDLESNNVQRPKYEYEPYDESLEHNINRAMTNEYEDDFYHNPRRDGHSNNDNGHYDNSQGQYHNDNYYDNSQREYHDDSHYDNSQGQYHNDNYYDNSQRDNQNDDFDAKDSKPEKNVDESSEKVIKRHFDKFKK